MFVHLVIVEPEARRGRHKVRLPLLVGRCREAKLRIQQDRVSRRHCELTAEDGMVRIRDLGSRNGTLLGGIGVPNDRSMPVPPGSTVHVGTLVFRVEYDHLAETPTVEIPAVPSASSPTLGLIAEAPFDVEIAFDQDGSTDPPDHGRPLAQPPAALASDADGEDDELDRFLEGLG